MRRNIFTVLLTLAVMVSAGGRAEAQKKCGEEWKEKMQNEKIAFLTAEIGLTPEEGQAFWPVYNQVNEEKDKAMHQVIMAYKALDKALDENKSKKEISGLLDAYLQAQDNQRDTDSEAADKYRKVLPTEKVAKLYVSEEKFRRQHIRKLHERHNGPKPPQANK
ncbi:MAG: hypothetical protein IJ005_04180 [Bacteroidales bacterium]|nr:hypothetical protein [Bacteroidales bacterium]